MLKKLILPCLLVCLLAALGYSLTRKNQVPNLRLTTISGQTIDLADLRGKMVLVNFWATTCPGCIAEMPGLVDSYRQRHAQGFELIAVAMTYDPPDQVRNYTASHQLPFPIVLDTQGTLAQAFGDVRLTPTAILIDKQGNIVRSTVGELDFATLNRRLDAELGRAG